MSTVVDKIKKDQKVRKFYKLLEGGSLALDTNSYLAELDNMHRTRHIRLLTTKDVLHNFQRKVVQATVQNQAYRSRCVEIKMSCYRAQTTIEGHRDTLKAFLKVEYKTALQVYKTISEREDVVASVLSVSDYYLQQLELTQEIADLIINDIDQASWSVKTLIGVLQLASSPETI